MSHSHYFNMQLKKDASGAPVSVHYSHLPLWSKGLNLPAEISIPSGMTTKAPRSGLKSLAHFDTGASMTAIDIQIVKHLGLS